MKIEDTIDNYLNEATNKGFTITCNKCGAVGNVTKDNTIMPKNGIEIIVDSEEDGLDGSSIGLAELKCKKCGQMFTFNQ